jgi:hypothetical protein
MLPISRDPVPFCPARERVKGLETMVDDLLARVAASDPETDQGAQLAKTLQAVEAMLAEARATLEGFEASGENPPTYLVRPALEREKMKFRRELTAAGGRAVTTQALRKALRDGIKALASEEVLPALLATVDAVELVLDGGDAEPLPDEVLAQYREIEEAVRQSFDPFRQLVADRDHWAELAPYLAAQFFLVGRAGEKPLPRKGGLVPEEVLEALPEEDRKAIGSRALALVYMGEAERKNFESRSSSAASAKPSATTSTPASSPPAGTSSATITTATPPS